MSTEHTDDKQSIDYKDEETLRRLYLDERMSTVEIADLAGVWPSTISDWLDRHGIPARDRIEASREKRSVDYAYHGMTGGGYMEWVSQWHGERDTVRVCRLLAVAEYGFEAVAGMHVHHKNEIRWLDYPDNIELRSPEDHLRQHVTGDDNPQAKLSEMEASRVRELALEGNLTQQEIADEFDISQGHVSDLKNGKRR